MELEKLNEVARQKGREVEEEKRWREKGKGLRRKRESAWNIWLVKFLERCSVPEVESVGIPFGLSV